MNPPLKTIAATLLAGAITVPMTACSKDLPTQPADKTGATAARPGISPAITAANDDFDGATVVTSLPFTDAVNTSEATTAADDPEDCVGTGPTVWYQFTPSENIRIIAYTFGSNYDTGLSAYTGTRGNLVQIACNDDAGGSLQSLVTIDAAAGQTLFFMVGAFASGPGGDLVFNVDVPPPPLEIDLGIDRFGSVNASTGVATIRGTLTCSRQAFASLDGTLQQRIGRVLVNAFFFTFFECDGVTPWETEVVAPNVLLVGGPVEVSAFAFVDDPIGGEPAFAQASATVHLRGSK
jgi:hypothetical protein